MKVKFTIMNAKLHGDVVAEKIEFEMEATPQELITNMHAAKDMQKFMASIMDAEAG